jgi:hypothetical protein
LGGTKLAGNACLKDTLVMYAIGRIDYLAHGHGVTFIGFDDLFYYEIGSGPQNMEYSAVTRR